MRNRGSDVRQHELDLPAEEVLVRRPDPLVRHVDEARAGVLLQHADPEVGRAAGARGAESDPPGRAPAERDQVRDGAHRERRVHDEHQRPDHAARHRREVALGVVWQALEEARIDGQRRIRRDEERIAVGRRLRRRGGADVAARARPVVHDELLLERFAERLRKDARIEVGPAARRRGHDEAHRL
jgi:hypothetical protein